MTAGKQVSYDVIIIGAGAAGLMAASAAAGRGLRILVLEKNEKAGKKIYITGKGRGNLTNTCETQDFFRAVRRNPKFLYSAVSSFDQADAIRFFEENGCPVKIERGNRAFPVSDHASDLTAALLRSVSRDAVRILFNSTVTEILTSAAEPSVRGVRLQSGGEFFASSVIVATGGLSYPSTGSTGDGYRFAEKLGHRVADPQPSLVPFETKESWCSALQGLSLKNVELTVLKPEEAEEDGKPQKKKKKSRILYQGFGELLFTHFGISGPLVLSASAETDFEKYPQGFQAVLNLKPALDDEQLKKRILREIEPDGRMQMKALLRKLLPGALSAEIAGQLEEKAGIGTERTGRSLNEREIAAVASYLHAVPLTLTGTRGFAEAVVTKGGVDPSQVNPSTMESKLVKGLYFAGEVLDVDALTGGYNLQIAWSTGRLAGVSICGK